MSNNNFKNSGITFGSYATFFWEKWHMNRWFAFFETIFQKPENAPQHYRIWDFFTFVFFLEIFFGNSSYNTITSKNVLKTRSKSLLALRVALTDGLPYIYIYNNLSLYFYFFKKWKKNNDQNMYLSIETNQ